MQYSPFRLFGQFSELDIRLFTKSDRVNMHQDITATLGRASLAIPRQVHGTKTIVAHAPMLLTKEADGIVTNIQGLTIAIAMADCQTFVVYAPKRHVIGLLHAGWRGLTAGATCEFFAVLKKEYGIDPADTYIAAGPSLCQNCSEFTDPKRELPRVDPKFFSDRLVDLRGIADRELDRVGIPPSQRERHPDCTRCRSDLYWSYRGPDREKVREGWENFMTCTISHAQSDR